jgi:hypothetical protein
MLVLPTLLDKGFKMLRNIFKGLLTLVFFILASVLTGYIKAKTTLAIGAAAVSQLEMSDSSYVEFMSLIKVNDHIWMLYFIVWVVFFGLVYLIWSNKTPKPPVI